MTGSGVHDRDLLFLVARVPLLVGVELKLPAVHHQIMQTVYKLITGSAREVDVPSSGPVWERIGFQGGRPHTDLRDTGMLSLLQMLAFLERHRNGVRRMWALSRDPTHGFPLMVVSIRMTLLTLQTVRQGRLTKEANSECDVWEVAQRFYMALLYKCVP